MTSYITVLTEGLIIGVVTGIIGFIISTIIMYYSSNTFSLQKYTFWPQVVFSYALTGFLIHVFFEYTGSNKQFCCQYNRFNCVN